MQVNRDHAENRIKEWLDRAQEIVEEAGFSIEKTREIQQGVQWIVGRAGSSIPINIYHSKKRGITVVYGGSPTSPVRVELERLLGSAVAAKLAAGEPLEMPFASWVGTDESGKGDYFGPLVVAGFAADHSIAPRLAEMGVRDSKSMADSRVAEVARDLLQRFGDRLEVVEILPPRYNEIMEKFRKEGKNLNHLLGWAHARVLENLMQRRPFEAALADQFGDERYIREALKSMGRLELRQTPRAERDPAVAAASVVARYRFLMRLKRLSKKLGLDLPKGAGNNVMAAGRAIFLQAGMEKLAQVAKLHFALTGRLEQWGEDKPPL